jgi:two-component system, NarL family, nitrate/nitrite response regulator NarL
MVCELPWNDDASRIRIVILDHHEIVCEGVSMLVATSPRMLVVGWACDHAKGLAVTSREQPDILLLELDPDGCFDLEFLGELTVCAPKMRVILLTAICDPELHREAVRLGAMAIVSKRHDPKVLFDAIEKVHAGEAWLDDRSSPAESKMTGRLE